MRRVKLARITVRLPEDLLTECYRFIGEGRVCCLRHLIEAALMEHMNLGRCERTGLLCRADTPACEFYEPRRVDGGGS